MRQLWEAGFILKKFEYDVDYIARNCLAGAEEFCR